LVFRKVERAVTKELGETSMGYNLHINIQRAELGRRFVGVADFLCGPSSISHSMREMRAKLAEKLCPIAAFV
jgi:hypothetical protein